MKPLSVLFPTDFSPGADKALNEAIYFCKKTGSTLLIYHVYHRPVTEAGAAAEMTAKMNKLETAIDKKFEDLGSKHVDLSKIDHTFKRELGSSIEKVIETVERGGINLIISATKGAKGFGELWGSKTEKIIRGVGIPVLIIPDGSTLNEIRKIGLSCDYSEQTKYESLELAVDMAEHFQSNVDVISLNQDVLTQAEDETNGSEEARNRKIVRALLEDVHTSFSFTFNEDIERGILEYCRENEIDLIAMVPKNYSFIQRLFHESLTKKMIFHSPLPLLVLK